MRGADGDHCGGRKAIKWCSMCAPADGIVPSGGNVADSTEAAKNDKPIY